MVLRDVHKSPGIGNEPNRAAKIGDLFEGVHPEPSEESPVSVNGADDQPATTIDKTDSSKEGATLAETTNTTHSDSVKADDWASRIERVTLLLYGDSSREELLKAIVFSEMRKKQNKKSIDYYSRYQKELEFLRRTVEVAHKVEMLEYLGAPDKYDDNLNYEVWMYGISRSVKWDTIIKNSAYNMFHLDIFLDKMKSSLSSEDFLRIGRIVQSTLNICYNRIRANLISGETGENVVEDPCVSIVMNGLEASKEMMTIF